MSSVSDGPNTKYGFCKVIKEWIPRDSMLGINVKVFDEDNKEYRIPIRVSPKGHAELENHLQSLEWDNKLMTREELDGVKASLAM